MLPNDSSKDSLVQFKSESTKKVFDSLVDSFIEDYMAKKYVAEKSGWRSLSEIAQEAQVSTSLLYGKHSTMGSALDEPVRRGLIETRIFPGERGRGGEVLRLRIAYDKEPIRDFVNRRIMTGRSLAKTQEVDAPIILKPTTDSDPFATNINASQANEIAAQSQHTIFDKKRIAILPFSNISPNPNDEYFADGMTEELTSALSKISGLQVIARTSVLRYKGGSKSIDEIGKELKVGTILEGSVRKVGEKLRVTAQLIDSQDSRHLWSESYDKELRDVFAIQSEIAQSVAQATKVQLLFAEKVALNKEPFVKMEAYTQYLKGRFFWNQRNRESIKKAVECFEQALKNDPEYALAHVGLADSYFQLTAHGYMPPEEAYPKAKFEALKALELDDMLVEAHTTLAALLANYDWDWREAEVEFKRAIDLNPNYSNAHLWYGSLLLHLGRHEEAFVEIRKAHELDPLSQQTATTFGNAYEALRQYDLSIEMHKRSLELDPSFIPARMNLAELYVIKFMFSEAEQEIQKVMSFTSVRAPFEIFLGFIAACSGRKEEAKRVLFDYLGEKGEREKKYVPPELFAILYNALGDKDKAFEWLEVAIMKRSSFILDIKNSPLIDDLRSDARYQSLLRKLNLE